VTFLLMPTGSATNSSPVWIVRGRRTSLSRRRDSSTGISTPDHQHRHF